MQLLVLVFVVVTLVVAGSMLFHSMVWGGVALLIGSLLGFFGGGGLRGAMYLGQRKSGMIIGALLLFGGMALVFYSDVTLRLFGVELSGDVWVALGFAIGFLAARPEDARITGRSHP